jgi:plastocyanin domain-containing protein
VVVPAANWRKTLEVGQSATVVYTPTKSGTLAFACGMGMMKGSVVVQ